MHGSRSPSPRGKGEGTVAGGRGEGGGGGGEAINELIKRSKLQRLAAQQEKKKNNLAGVARGGGGIKSPPFSLKDSNVGISHHNVPSGSSARSGGALSSSLIKRLLRYIKN